MPSLSPLSSLDSDYFQNPKLHCWYNLIINKEKKANRRVVKQNMCFKNLKELLYSIIWGEPSDRPPSVVPKVLLSSVAKFLIVLLIVVHKKV